MTPLIAPELEPRWRRPLDGAFRSRRAVNGKPAAVGENPLITAIASPGIDVDQTWCYATRWVASS